MQISGVGIAAGVEHIHKAGIAHLDLKSNNVLLSKDGVPRICDFGHAATRQEGEARPHHLLGTPITAAPEVLLELNVGLPADIWSIGVMPHMSRSSSEGLRRVAKPEKGWVGERSEGSTPPCGTGRSSTV